MKRRVQKHRKKPQRGNRKLRKRVRRNGPSTLMVRAGGFQPDRALVKFKYFASATSQTLMNNIGGGSASREYCTGLYQVDPNISGPSTLPGQDAWAGFYNTYRIYAMKITTTFVNLEVFPVTVCHFWSRFALGTNSSNAQYWPDNRYAKSRYLGPTGSQNRSTITSYMPIKKFVGDAEVKADLSWTAGLAGASNPVYSIYCEVGAIPSGGATMLAGIGCRTIVTLYTELFNPINILQ